MSSLISVRGPVLLAALALAAPVPALRAQRPVSTLTPVRITTALRSARADTLESLATKVFRRNARWGDAARLQRRAAEMRGDDPRAVESFARAAWMYAAGHYLTQARGMMERAAEHAIEGGDIERGAGAYLDAALMSIEAGRDDLVPSLVRKTRRLVESPLLPAERRMLILQRVDGNPAVAAFWHRDDSN